MDAYVTSGYGHGLQSSCPVTLRQSRVIDDVPCEVYHRRGGLGRSRERGRGVEWERCDIIEGDVRCVSCVSTSTSLPSGQEKVK